MAAQHGGTTGQLKLSPIACTLNPGDLRERLGLIHALTVESLLGYGRNVLA